MPYPIHKETIEDISCLVHLNSERVQIHLHYTIHWEWNMIYHFHWDTNTTSLWQDHATATNWVAKDVRTWVRTWSAPSQGYAWMTKGDTTSQSPRRSNTEFLTTDEGPARCKHGETWPCWRQFLEILLVRNKLKFTVITFSFFFFSRNLDQFLGFFFCKYL